MDTPKQPNGRRLDGPIRRIRPHTREDRVPLSEPARSNEFGVTRAIEPETNPVTGLTVAPAESLPEIAPFPRYGTARPLRQAPKPGRLRRWIVLAIGLIIIAGIGWFGLQAYLALHNIIQKHYGTSVLNGDLDLSSLKGEGSGRVNILVMGIGGAGHDGPDLTDTMIVWSIDPKTYNVAAISVPRDLYVKIPGYGYNKLNSANADGGAALAEQVVGNVLGITINYYVIADFSGFKQAVDAVGGVDINVPTALYDTTYPCDVGNGICPYRQPAGLIHMNGATALKFARCRHDVPVGNCGNDQGRSARQQELIAALKAKTLSAGTLTNPAKLTALINTLGGHLKTDLQLSDMNKLAQLATKVDTSKITNKVLDDSPTSYLIGGVDIIPGAGYIYVPKAGNFNYSDIHDFVKNIFVDRFITSENARVQVENGSGVTGLAGKVSTSLVAAHYNVLPPANAPANSPATVLYDYTNGKKPYTIKYLEDRFGVKSQKATASPLPTPLVSTTTTPAATAQTPEIRIILGIDYSPQTGSSN